MIEQTEGVAVRQSVVVQAPPERAFEVFTAGMSTWWPLDSHNRRAAGDRRGDRAARRRALVRARRRTAANATGAASRLGAAAPARADVAADRPSSTSTRRSTPRSRSASSPRTAAARASSSSTAASTPTATARPRCARPSAPTAAGTACCAAFAEAAAGLARRSVSAPSRRRAWRARSSDPCSRRSSAGAARQAVAEQQPRRVRSGQPAGLAPTPGREIAGAVPAASVCRGRGAGMAVGSQHVGEPRAHEPLAATAPRPRRPSSEQTLTWKAAPRVELADAGARARRRARPRRARGGRSARRSRARGSPSRPRRSPRRRRRTAPRRAPSARRAARARSRRARRRVRSAPIGKDLAAGVQPQREPLAVERRLERGGALRDRQRVERYGRRADVRRDGGLAHAVGDHPRGVLERGGLVGRAVVHPRQQVEVKVDVSHHP